MEHLKTLEAKIERILEKFPRTRESDRELTYMVWLECYDINPWSPVSEIMRNDKLPSQESIGRIRRKLQEKREDLRGTKKEAIRMERQKTFIEYANSDTY